MLILDDYTVQQTGKIHLDLTFEVHVTAEQAQQIASQWAQDEITMHLTGETPILVLFSSDTGYEAIWRVPLTLQLLRKGTFAVADVEVSAMTGEIIDLNATKQHINDVLEKKVRPTVEQTQTLKSPKPTTTRFWTEPDKLRRFTEAVES